MRYFLAVSLFAGSTVALAAPRIECSGLSPSKAQITLQATVSGPELLTDIQFFLKDDKQNYSTVTESLEGRSDASQISPQAGTRFYFHSGNVSAFVLFADGILQNVNDTTAFSAQYISEQYEQGGSQEITALNCTVN